LADLHPLVRRAFACPGESLADLHPLVRRAFACPGAVLIRRDVEGFKDGGRVGFQLGLQQPRKHVRFVNLFIYANEIWMYFKHDSARIAGLYQGKPSLVKPSEIASKYWSKVRVTGDSMEPWVVDLLETSRELVTASLTKEGRAALAVVDNVPNTFPVFHQLAFRHERATDARAYVGYSDTPDTPQLTVDGRVIAQFSWNALQLRTEPSMDWTTVGADCIDSWAGALETTVRAALDR
jgi:predicted DNA-binding protein (MmcQ/YjbR family)